MVSSSTAVSASDIVDGLTSQQARTCCLLFVTAIVELDQSGDLPAFLENMRSAASETERMALSA